MDSTNPLRAIAPGVEGDVLQVLVRTRAGLTGARVAELAGRSGTQVRAVLGELERHGLVRSERHGQASSYLLNRDHVLADLVEGACRAAQRVEERVSGAVLSWSVQPVAVALFGSFARRDGDTESDLDLLVIRPDAVGPNDDAWTAQRHALARQAESWSGNRVQVLELSAAELAEAVQHDEPLIEGLRQDAVSLVGDIASALRVHVAR